MAMFLPNLLILRPPQTSRLSLDRLSECCSLLALSRWIRKRHAIAGAELPFLGLDVDIVQVHVVLDGADILVPQQRLQAEDVASEHEVAAKV